MMAARRVILDHEIGEEIGIRDKRGKSMAVELLIQASGKLLNRQYPFLELLPSADMVLSRITDQILLRVRSPRRSVLQMVGESILGVLHDKKQRD